MDTLGLVNRAGFAKVSLIAEAAPAEVSEIRLPLALSLAAHAAGPDGDFSAARSGAVRADADPDQGGIEVAFVTSLPAAEPAPSLEPPHQGGNAAAHRWNPSSAPTRTRRSLVAATESPAPAPQEPAPVSETPPPPPRKPLPKPVFRHPETPRPSPVLAPAQPHARRDRCPANGFSSAAACLGSLPRYSSWLS